MYIEPTTKRIFAIACLGKKLVFHTESCEFRESLFYRFKKLFKSIQTRYGASPVYIELKQKEFLLLLD